MTEQREREALSDADIDKIAETMPGGLSGFMKGWGWRNFARAIEGEVFSRAAATTTLTDAQIEEAVIEACHGDPLSSAPGEYRLTLDEIRSIVGLLSSQAQSEPSAGAQQLPVELRGVAETAAKGGGFWTPCTGCYDTEDGRPTQRYAHSDVFGCELGNGCRECGGIGAVWDDTDYAAMAEAMAEKDAAAAAPAPAKEG